MGKQKTATMGSFLQEMFQAGVYKRNQGRVTRQVTFGTLAAACALGAWRLFNFLLNQPEGARYGFATLALLVGLWFSFRIVNYPRFADFLIAVEAEMNKVSWPTRGELVRSSIVVIVVIIALAGVLFLYDIVWRFIFGPSVLNILLS